jgi:hypothetical protein
MEIRPSVTVRTDDTMYSPKELRGVSLTTIVRIFDLLSLDDIQNVKKSCRKLYHTVRVYKQIIAMERYSFEELVKAEKIYNGIYRFLDHETRRRIISTDFNPNHQSRLYKVLLFQGELNFVFTDYRLEFRSFKPKLITYVHRENKKGKQPQISPLAFFRESIKRVETFKGNYTFQVEKIEVTINPNSPDCNDLTKLFLIRIANDINQSIKAAFKRPISKEEREIAEAAFEANRTYAESFCRKIGKIVVNVNSYLQGSSE